jgi:hypothetical protein
VSEKKLPHLVIACLCERVLQEKDNVLSVIRIVDVLTVPQVPPPDNQIPALLTVFVGIKAGDARGKHELSLRVRRPSGAVSAVGQRLEVELSDDPLGGANVVVTLPLKLSEFGLIWIDVLWDGDILSQIPFRLLLPGDAPVPEATPTIQN